MLFSPVVGGKALSRRSSPSSHGHSSLIPTGYTRKPPFPLKTTVFSCYFNQFRAPEESYSLYGCKYLVNSLRRASLDPEGPEPIEDSLNLIELSPEDDLNPKRKSTVPLLRSNSTVSLSEVRFWPGSPMFKLLERRIDF